MDLPDRIAARARARAQRTARSARIAREGDDFLLALAVDDMAERLSLVTRQFGDACALLAGAPRLAQALEAAPNVSRVERIEADDERSADALALVEGTFDLVCAPFGLHHAVDLPGALIQVRRALRPDGLLLATLPGPGTLRELRESLVAAEAEIAGGAAQRVDAFAEVRDAGALLQRAGLALPVTDTDSVTVRYGTLPDLVRDLRRMGVTFAHPAPASRALFERAATIYADRFADPDGRLRATFEIVSMSGWAPHESQQKPLKPGSAKASLAEALKVSPSPQGRER